MTGFKGLLDFNDGSVLGKVSEYGTPENFFNVVTQERDLNSNLCEGDEPYTVNDVETVWIRWYPKGIDILSSEFPDGCYSIDHSKRRGSFPAFTIGGE